MPEDCNIVLEDLLKKGGCEDNASGVKKIAVFLTEDVHTWPERRTAIGQMRDYVELDGDLVFKQGKRAFVIHCKDEAGELHYEGQGEEGSRSQKGILNIYNPCMKSPLLGFIAAVQNADIGALAWLNNGEVHLLGDKDRGMHMSENNATSGKAIGDPNGGDLTFDYNCSRAQVYTGQTDGLTEPTGRNAAIETGEAASLTATGATLSGTCTDPNGEVTEAGVMYRKEGVSQWSRKPAEGFTSGQPFSVTLTDLTASSDYLYCAYMVVEGRRLTGADMVFTTTA